MATVRRVVIPYAPRPQFQPFHARTERWACIVAHRRAGKTVAAINDKIKGALKTSAANARYGYIAPFRNQAKAIAWDYLKHFSGPVPGITVNESELRIDYPNGSQIRLFGADNPDAMRGLYFDHVTLDEYADMDPTIWPLVIRPALADRKGGATFIGTPKGRNDFWRIWAGDDETGWPGATKDPAWFSLMLKASETGIIPPDELADLRRTSSQDQYEQEFECSFEAAIRGAFYAEELRRMKAEKRICRIPIDRSIRVWTAWDLGVSDSTAIIFGQTVGREERIIDYYEGSGVGLDHYARVLRDKDYVYSEHIFPHDIQHRELSTGLSRMETLRSLGITARVAPIHAIMDGINATRRYMDRLWIDEDRCKRFLEAITQYRREYDEKLKTFKLNPLHDWTSHGADALRTRAALAPTAEIRPRYGRTPASSGSWMTA